MGSNARHKTLICFGLNVSTSVVLLTAFYFSCLDHGVADHLHARYWNYAIPAALSELSYGLNGYRAYMSVLMHFVGNHAQEATPEAADRLIASASMLSDVA